MHTVGRLFPDRRISTRGHTNSAASAPRAFVPKALDRGLIRSIIDVRRKAENTGSPRDLFDLLSQAHGADREDLLVDEVSTMIVAGHETDRADFILGVHPCSRRAKQWQEALAAESAPARSVRRRRRPSSLPKLEA